MSHTSLSLAIVGTLNTGNFIGRLVVLRSISLVVIDLADALVALLAVVTAALGIRDTLAAGFEVLEAVWQEFEEVLLHEQESDEGT